MCVSTHLPRSLSLPNTISPLNIVLYPQICVSLHTSLTLSLAQPQPTESTKTQYSGRLKEWGQKPGIDIARGLSSELGGERRFQFDLDDGKTSLTLLLKHGSVWTETSAVKVLFEETPEDLTTFSVDNSCILTGRV